MASRYYHGKRVGGDHYTVLAAYERKYGVPAQVNQGRRTLAEQWTFWNHYRTYGWPLAAYPSPAAPHIKYGRNNHALDINAGSGRGQAQHVAAYYRSLGIPVTFNVRGEPWHMDTLDSRKLAIAAARLRQSPTLKLGSRGQAVKNLKRLMWAKGLRRFERSTGYFGPGTKRAIIRFQKKHNLKADGVVGPRTWKELRD
jgi:peptidoglycan hydrolase-like protein with peptidoglycan-binding domain